MGQLTISTPGSGSWTVPTGVTSIDLLLIGGGGGGASAGGKGGGGGGGSISRTGVSVTAGMSISYTVGAGGSYDSAGSNSVWDSGSMSPLTAGGGGAGIVSTGGAGGTGDHAGGTGGNGASGVGGGGGASGGRSAAGNNGANSITGGTAVSEGGAGGDGDDGSGNPQNGGFPGGGGGGSFAMTTGGEGGDGFLQIDWTVTLPDAAVPICNALEQDEQSMIFLRKSTNSQEVPLGFFLDETDGATTLTALTIAASDIKLFKAGATSEVNKNSGGATHLADGRYYAVFNSTDTDTAGSMTIHIHVSGALPRTIYCTVLDANMYDWWTGNTAPGSGTALDAAGVRSAVGLASANLDTQLSTLTGYVDTEVAAIKAKTDNLPSDPADASVVAGLIAAVEAKVDTVDTVVDTILTKVDTEIADIQSRLPATLISGRMDSHVGAMGSNTLTAAALATDAVTEIQSGLATADDVTDSDVVLCRYGGAFTSSAGTEFRASAWLERNGQIVVLASGTCTLTFRENASGSDLFTVTDSAPNAQGIFEIVKTSPGFTSDRLQIATVEIDDGVNPVWVTRHPVPIR